MTTEPLKLSSWIESTFGNLNQFVEQLFEGDDDEAFRQRRRAYEFIRRCERSDVIKFNEKRKKRLREYGIPIDELSVDVDFSDLPEATAEAEYREKIARLAGENMAMKSEIKSLRKLLEDLVQKKK